MVSNLCDTVGVLQHTPSLCSELVKYRKCYKLRAKCRSPDRHQGWKETASKSAWSPTELKLPRKTLHFFRDREKVAPCSWLLQDFLQQTQVAQWPAVQVRESHRREVGLGLGSKLAGQLKCSGHHIPSSGQFRDTELNHSLLSLGKDS